MPGVTLSDHKKASGQVRVIIIMGVAGSGKTTVGRRLAERLGWPFYEGDDLHPAPNVDKMAGGQPLTDEDRKPWLDRIAQLIGERLERGLTAVIASSALKRSYRRRLRKDREEVVFVHLEGDFDLIRQRMEAREEHFMKAKMSRSQFEALERPEPDEAITVDAAASVEKIVGEIVQRLPARESAPPMPQIRGTFDVYPAIDLRHGRVVRLKHGDPERQTSFSDDPESIAERWLAAGAAWLHVVNLDGAFQEGGATNWNTLPALTALGAQVQFGGGLRHMDDVERAFGHGVARVVLGTVAVENPELVEEAIDRFGAHRVAVGLDARDGKVRTRGWQADGGLGALTLAQRMRARGVTMAIHTDISRDGVFAGVNAAASAELAQKSGLYVIASGGVASIEDVSQTVTYREKGVVGVIAGRALYEGRLELAEALDVVRSAVNV